MISERMCVFGENRSAIRDLFEYGTARKDEIGADKVFDFSIGNPSVDAPQKVKDCIREMLDNFDSIRLHGYTSAAGLPQARAAAAAQESLRAGKPVPADGIYMTCGAAASLSICLKALACPGDRVAVLAPFFPEYSVFIENAGITQVVIPNAGADMQPNLEQLRKQARQGLKAVIINSPNNPSGAVYSEDTLKRIADILREAERENGRTVYIIADEPYRELVYDGAQVPYIPNIYGNTLVCYSYSKSLSLPGERIGYILVPPEAQEHEKLFAAVCGAGRALGYVCAPSMFQYVVAECAAERPDISRYDRCRRLLYDELTALGFECVRPSGAFYLFVKAPDGDADGLSRRAMKHEILIVPSGSFGIDGYCRVAYCVSERTITESFAAWRALAGEYFG